MKRSFLIIFVAIFLALAVSACQPASVDPEVIVITQEVTVVVVVTATPETAPGADVVVAEPTTAVVEGDWILPENAMEHVGEFTSVRIEQAHCSYQESTNGTPTFCNDRPYPNHNFTFVVWGQDWSHYDGQCVIVDGEIEVFNGKAQIEVEDEGQISMCP